MHIALNAQEALVEWGHSLLSSVWSSGFPDSPFDMFNVRPIRRVAILSFMVLSWQPIRHEIVQACKSTTMTETRRFFVGVLLWLFEEAIPLALDAPSLLASGNLDIYLDVLKQLLPLFVRFRKQNYIVIVSYILAAVPRISGTNAEGAFRDALQHLSSEDLEVFHSVLRASTRYQDTQAQVARKALMITSRLTSPLRVLKRWSDLKNAIEEEEV